MGVMCQSARNADLKPNPITVAEVFTDKELVNRYLNRALLSVGQLTNTEMNSLTKDFEERKRLDPTITPESYMQKLTKDWKTPERPNDFTHAPEGTPTDLELFAQDPNFLSKRYKVGR